MSAISTFPHNSNLKMTTGIFCLFLNSTPSSAQIGEVCGHILDQEWT